MRTKVVMGLLTMMIVCGCNERKHREVLPVKVKTITVGTTTVGGLQTYSGTIEEQSGSSLSFAGMGTVKSINVSQGQFVHQGQLIATIDASTSNSSMNMAQATTAQAEDALKQAEDAYQRMKMLHDNGSLPEIQWIEMETKLNQARSMVKQAKAAEQIARKGVQDTRLFAPFSGYISQKSVEVGANVAPGVPVVKLVKIGQVKVKISVPEEEIAAFHKGQTLHVRVAALGNRVFESRVSECGVSADPLSRSYEVKGTIANPHHELLPGMVCEVSTNAQRPSSDSQHLSPSFISLPANIVQIDADNQPFVWIVEGGKAHKALVTTSENIGDNVLIASGLKQGDKVIVEGGQKVSTDMKVVE